jgi:hypothetical protein
MANRIPSSISGAPSVKRAPIMAESNDNTAAPDDWRERVRALSAVVRSKSSPADSAVAVLRLAQVLRTAGKISHAREVHMIMWSIEGILIDRFLKHQTPALHRLLKEDPDPDPDRAEVRSREFTRIDDILTAAALEEFGEPELAALYRTSPAEVAALYEEGRREVNARREIKH